MRYDAGEDRTVLLWDPNGDDPAGGAYLMAIFSGEITLTPDDILIL